MITDSTTRVGVGSSSLLSPFRCFQSERGSGKQKNTREFERLSANICVELLHGWLGTVEGPLKMLEGSKT